MAGEWSEYEFSDLCDITRGASPRPIHEWISEEGIPWLKIADASATESRFIDHTKERIRPEGIAKSVPVFPGDLILSNSATPGIPKFVGIEACIHDGWLLLRNLRHLDKLFCYYLLLFERLRIVEQGSGTVFINLKTDILKKHRVKIPPVPEQRAIAHILGTLDDKIELNRRMNQTLEEMARAIFRDWFVDFGPVRAKLEGREPYLPAELWDLFPDRLVDSELGEIPEGWEVKALSDCIDVARGLSYKGSGLSSTGIPMHNLNSVYEGGGYKDEGIKYYQGDFQERHVSRPGDVIVANTEQGHDRLLIGFAAIVPRRFGDMGLFSHHTYRIRPKSSCGLFPDFWCHLLNTRAMHDTVSGYATGTTVNMLPVDALRIPPIVVPSIQLAKAFTATAQAARVRQECLITECEHLAAQRDVLLPQLVSGELRAGRATKPYQLP